MFTPNTNPPSKFQARLLVHAWQAEADWVHRGIWQGESSQMERPKWTLDWRCSCHRSGERWS